MPFDEPGIQAITLGLTCSAAVLSFVSVMVGLLSTLTGRDPLPKRIRSLMRRTPASAEDFRLRGMRLALNGVAVMLIASGLATNVVERLALGTNFAAYAPSASSASLAFPKYTVFLVNTVAAIVVLAFFIGAYTLSVRVRYVSKQNSTATLPAISPA